MEWQFAIKWPFKGLVYNPIDNDLGFLLVWYRFNSFPLQTP